MKILMLTDRMERGGAETHIAALARGLLARGAEVEILSSGGAISDELEQEGIRQHRMPLCTHNPLRLLLLRHRLKKLVMKNGYDILHAHARIPACLLRGMRSCGAARIVTVHAKFRSGRVLSELCFWGERTIAVSEDLRDYVCDTYGICGESVRVIPNGIDCQAFSPADKPQKRGINLLFASRLDRDCSLGAILLCRLAPSLSRSYPALTIGIAGGGSMADEIRRLADHANRLVGRECVVMHGQVEDMAALLRTQDVFVGVSRAAMEAAACGCAVILCGNEGYLGILDRQSMQEAILSNFCCRESPAPQALRLECDIRRLLDRPELCRRLGAEACERIRTEFDARSMCDQTYELYRRAVHPPYRRNLLIGGYFGCGNVGDDAILHGFLEGMHQMAPDVQIQALTADPVLCEKRFGIRCISRKNPIAIRYAMGSADMFVCGGGSLLQNATSNRSLRYYLSLLRMAKRADCITVLYAAGVGPLYGKRAEKRVQKVLSQCHYISLRDPNSLRDLIKCGIDRSLLHMGADPALLLSLPSPSRSAFLLRAHSISPAQKRLCVVLRRIPRDTDHLWQSVIIAVRILCRRHGLQPIILLFCKEDVLPAEALCNAVGGKMIAVREVGDLAALLRDSHAILSMRLHALILAAASAKGAIGLSADPNDGKIISFARLSGQTALPYPRPSVAELVALAEKTFFGEHSKNDALIADAVSELRKKAWKDLENITEMIYNKENAELRPHRGAK